MSSQRNLEELNRIYNQSEICDKSHFAEQRSNIRLCSSDHYKKVTDSLRRGFQDPNFNRDQRVRLTKNHIQKICKNGVNTILSLAPGVEPVPYNKSEMKDIEAARIAKAVMDDGYVRHRFDEKVDEWGEHFIQLGEIAVKIYWDPFKGKIISYNQKTDDFGRPLYKDKDGKETIEKDSVESTPNGEIHYLNEPCKGTANYEGDLCVETIPAFNLLRDPASESMESSPYLIYRKMVPVERVKAMVGDDHEKKQLISADADETFKVFDLNTADYNTSRSQVMVREYYFRPTPEMPEGEIIIATQNVELYRGPIPFADELGDMAFPIKYAGYEKYPTLCRAKSMIRHLRPYQLEINRAASYICESQISFQPKLIIQGGTKISKGIDYPGIRTIVVNGPAPQIMEGQSGEQYLNYLNSQIDECYRISPYPDFEYQDNSPDMMVNLLKRMSQRTKAVRYAKKFERFLIDVFGCYLALAKRYYPDEKMIKAVGKDNFVNIAEFRSTGDDQYSLKLVASNKDIDSQMGRYMAITNVLQYAGDIPTDLKLKLLRNLPFIDESVVDDLSLNEDVTKDMLLSLDRGEPFTPNPHDDAGLMIKSLISRMRKTEFRFLPPEVQQNYQMILQTYQEIEAQQQKDIQMAQQGFIPSDGPLVSVEYYVETIGSKGQPKTERAKLPANAIQWVIDKLNEQGIAQDRLQEIGSQQAIADVLSMIQQQPGMDAYNQSMPPVLPETMAQGGYDDRGAIRNSI